MMKGAGGSGEPPSCTAVSLMAEDQAPVSAVEDASGGDINGVQNRNVARKLGHQLSNVELKADFRRRRRGGSSLDSRRTQRDPSSSSSSSSSLSSFGGVRIKRRRCRPLLFKGSRAGGDDLQDLALPLGMSFAAIVAQVLDRKTTIKEAIPSRHLSMICNSAVKESISSIYGNRFDSFMSKFEKSFGSTLKTLRSINTTSINIEDSCSFGSHSSTISDVMEPVTYLPESHRSTPELFGTLPYDICNNEIVLHGGVERHLSTISHGNVAPRIHHSYGMSVFEKSVAEQSRSNDLKELEIGMAMRSLQMKQVQLNLDKVKISMGISKATFREEKFRCQIQEAKLAEFLKRCIDFLVTGLVIMSGLLVYGAYVFSYQRIMDATVSCSEIAKGSKSWWVPKQISSFNAGWSMLRCHTIVITRMAFGLLMILAVAYSLLHRTSVSASTMPVTFILLLLGAACGAAGKLCMDTLGGNGYRWLLIWEALVSLHFLANAFPYMVYRSLYGPVSVSHGIGAAMFPYRLRCFVFYSLVLVVLPAASGMLPFGSFLDWKEHFSQKMSLWISKDALQQPPPPVPDE